MSVSATGPVGTLGFLGVGAIGRPIAERILRHFPLIVCDADATALKHFEGQAETVQSAAELGNRADIVFSCLPSLQAHRIGLLDAGQGLIAGSRVRGLVQTGTTGPNFARSFTVELAKRGVAMIDAPVTGGVPRAREGALTVIVSGDLSLFLECETAIRSFAGNVVYLGDRPGSAQTMKLINNLLSATNLAIGCEALVLGAKAGLDPRQMIEVLNTGTGQNSATLTKIPDHILPRRFDYGGRMDLVCKDLKALVEEAHLLGVPVPFATFVTQVYRDAAEAGLEDKDMTTIVQLMEKAAGLEVASSY